MGRHSALKTSSRPCPAESGFERCVPGAPTIELTANVCASLRVRRTCTADQASDDSLIVYNAHGQGLMVRKPTNQEASFRRCSDDGARLDRLPIATNRFSARHIEQAKAFRQVSSVPWPHPDEPSSINSRWAPWQ